jgi:protein required for attachment to host cells
MGADATIIVLANEHSSRVLLWQKAKGTIEDLAEFCESADFFEHTDPQPADLCKRSGRVMLKARTKKQEELLTVFLRRVAAQVDLAVSQHQAGALVLLAPPLVLGRLRDLLTASTRMKLVCEVTEDLIDASASDIEGVLKGFGPSV